MSKATDDRAEPLTLRMIADEIGVSVSTVSRVLKADGGDATRWASADTVARIRDFATSREYRPNPHAASLRTARSRLVGVLVPRLQDFVLATVYEGIEEAATERGYSTFVTNSLDDPANKAARTEMMLQRRVEGMIFGDAHTDDPLLAEMAKRRIPFVLVSRRSGDYASVTCDDLLGGRLVGRHLVRRGRRDLAVLAGLPFASTAIERTKGAVDAFAEAGLEVPPDRIEWGPFDAAGGRQAAEKLLAHKPYPDAIFATNDFAAIGALGVLRDRGLHVPDDIALIGYNDTPLAAEMPIPLTTVRSPMHRMGRRGVELLIDVLAGAHPQSERLEPELIVRESG